jgi:hypothetical protein
VPRYATSAVATYLLIGTRICRNLVAVGRIAVSLETPRVLYGMMGSKYQDLDVANSSEWATNDK